MGPPDQVNGDEYKRNGKQSVKIQRITSSSKGQQQKQRQGKASVRLSKHSTNALQENKAFTNSQINQQGVLNDHILNEQTIEQMERELNKDMESNHCSSSGQQSYVEGFLKVAHKKSPSEAILNRNIADITEQKQMQMDPSQIKKI